MIKPHLIDFIPAHMGEGNEEDGAKKLRDGVAWTGMQGDRYIASAGMVFPFGWGKPVGHAWITRWPRDRALMLWFGKTIRGKLRETVDQYRLHRVEATVIEWDTQARAWIESLGFVPEGLMAHYNPEGDSVVRYSIIFPEYLPMKRKEAVND